jgi:hypothetical protein
VTQHKLFDGVVPYVSTAEYHHGRDRAPHLEQEAHRPRLELAADFVTRAVAELPAPVTWSDLGCGDGGLLSLAQGLPGLTAWGYDFTPANAAAWAGRGVDGEELDVFGADRDTARLGDVVSMTEVLEHLADPHGVLAWARSRAKRLVCSSPWNEGPNHHDECHAWAWDLDGYAAMIRDAGWTIVYQQQAGLFQVVMAR